MNPFRYRGYYFDEETSLYNLQSRYYNPMVGRLVNADEADVLILAVDDVLFNNSYLYCYNEPIMNKDINGNIKINIKWLGTAIDLILWLIPALLAVSRIWKNVSRSASKLVSFGDKLIAAGKKVFKRFDDRLYCAFAKESTYVLFQITLRILLLTQCCHIQ